MGEFQTKFWSPPCSFALNITFYSPQGDVGLPGPPGLDGEKVNNN